MTTVAPGNLYLEAVIGVAIIASFAYACGRIHQWYRTSMDRDDAYRDGYNTAAERLFAAATREAVRPGHTRRILGTAKVVPITAAPSAGRHHADPDQMGAQTREVDTKTA